MKKKYISKFLCENVSCENVVLLQFENSFSHPLTLIKICIFFVQLNSGGRFFSHSLPSGIVSHLIWILSGVKIMQRNDENI